MSERQRTVWRLVADNMTRKVFTLRTDKKLIVAKEIMQWAHVRHVPVVNTSRQVVGMVSHRDLLAASIASVSAASELQRSQHLWTISIQPVMRTPVTTIASTATIHQAAALMRSKKIGCFPVVDNGRLVGIITDYDLLGALEQD